MKEKLRRQNIYFSIVNMDVNFGSFQGWLHSKNISMLPLNMCLIKTGVLLKEENLEFLFKNRILSAEHLIRGWKYAKTKARINGWKNELRAHCVKNKNAQRLFSLMFLLLD